MYKKRLICVVMMLVFFAVQIESAACISTFNELVVSSDSKEVELSRTSLPDVVGTKGNKVQNSSAPVKSYEPQRALEGLLPDTQQVLSYGDVSSSDDSLKTVSNQENVTTVSDPSTIQSVETVGELSIRSTSVAGGGTHTLVLREDGTVWASGDNSRGQLGDGTTKGRSVLLKVNGLAGVVSVAAGENFSAALKNDGTVWTWGDYTYGQLGDGTVNGRYIPGQVEGLTDVVSIACGKEHMLALKNNGTVWAWGNNGSGQLGDGTKLDKYSPVQVAELSGVAAVSAGNSHSAALKNDGTVWTWGDNSYGQLGDGIQEGKSDDMLKFSCIPVKVQKLDGIVAVACGGSHTAAVKNNGTVWTWGSNSDGQLGYQNGSVIKGFSNVPEQVSYMQYIVAVSAGQSHTVVLDIYQGLNIWGDNAYGQLGIGNWEDSYYPSYINSSLYLSSVSCGYNHTIALNRLGAVYTWGNNKYGQLGNGTREDKNTPYMAPTEIEAPKAPYGLTATLVDNEVRLSWMTPDYNDTVEGYKVCLDGAEVGDVSATDFVYGSIPDDGSSKVFSIKAYNILGDTSEEVFCSLNDTQPPSVPQKLHSTLITAGSIAIKWEASTDDYGVCAYEIYRDGDKVGTCYTTDYNDTGLIQGTKHAYNVRAIDTSGNVSEKSNIITVVTFADTTPPTDPARLNVSYASKEEISLYWDAASDNMTGKLIYEIFSDGEKVDECTTTRYIYQNPIRGKNYSFAVRARDLAGNVSGMSNSVSIMADDYGDSITEAGPIQVGEEVSAGINSWSDEDYFSFTPAADGVYIIESKSSMELYGYLYDDTGMQIAYNDDDGVDNNFLIRKKLMANKTYYLEVDSSNTGDYSLIILPYDLEDPSVPTQLTVTSNTDTTVSLEWTESQDNTGVIGYYIIRDGEIAGSSKSNSYTDSGLMPAGKYSYSVRAFDFSENMSAQSDIVTITTDNDTEPPAAPSHLGIYPDTDGIILRWDKSADNDEVKGYAVYCNDNEIGKTVECQLAYVKPGADENASFTVKAFDRSGNYSSESNVVEYQDLTYVPVYLEVYSKTDSTVTLTWSHIPQEIESAGYEIYRNDVSVARSVYNSYIDSGLSPETTYNYYVRAFNDGYIYSPPSNIVSVDTDAGCRGLIEGGYAHTLVLKDGKVFGCGYNSNGEIGIDNKNYYDRWEIKSLIEIPGLSGVRSVATGQYHSLAVKNDGTVWAWGDNWDSQLGDGTNQDRYQPVKVKGLTGIIEISAGYDFSMALKNDGTVWVWGDNSNGVLGVEYDSINIASEPVQVKGLEDVVAIAAGQYHCVALKRDGTVWTWGANWSGALGDGTYDSRHTPGMVQSMTDVKSIAAGYCTSIVLKNDGTVWAWGANWDGQLGNGTTESSNVPVKVQELTDVVYIAADYEHVLAVKNDGTAWAWGYNGYGQLGDGTTEESSLPVRVKDLENIKAVAAGQYHSIALDRDGNFWAWGGNDYGQLGQGNEENALVPVMLSSDAEPPSIPSDVKITAAGDKVCVSWKESSDNCFVLGYQVYRNNEIVASVDSRLYIDLDIVPGAEYKVKAYDASGNISEASNPVVLDNESPTVPANLKAIASTTTTVTLFWDASKDNTEVAGYEIYRDGEFLTTSETNSFTDTGLTPDKSYTYAIKAYDNGGNYSLSSNIVRATTEPLAINDPTVMSGGTYHTIAVKDGIVWTWGYNGYGQLGDGTFTDKIIPVQAADLQDIVAVEAGYEFSVALKSDGSLYTWGNGSNGELGDGRSGSSWSTHYVNTPYKVVELTGATSIAAGDDHCAVVNDGFVWTWGYNGSGQLGDGTYEMRKKPVQVQELTGVKSVACGSSYTVALKNDGTVWAWGDNSYGQLGDGTWDYKVSPVQVQGLTGIITVAAGNRHTVALKSDGTVWTWGDNYRGQLGDGTRTSKYSPVQVEGLTGIIAVAAGYEHALALKSDGTVWTWGSNNYGQLGDGTTTIKLVPVKVGGLSEVTEVAAGWYHSLAYKNDGTIYSWGYNYYGQLGNGTKNSSYTPVLAGSDIEPPAAPENLVARSTENTVSLTWDVPYDNVGVAGYDVYRNGEKLVTLTSPYYDDTSVEAGLSYEYYIKAFDISGNVSLESNLAWYDIEAPSAPLNVNVTTVTVTSINLQWDASTDNIGVAGYEIYRDGQKVGETDTASFTDVDLIPATNYEYSIKAFDAGLNYSELSVSISGATSIDKEAPTVPNGLYIYERSSSTYTLRWSNSTDNAKVTKYEIYRDGQKAGEKISNEVPGIEQYIDAGLNTDTQYIYTYTVRACDISGNVSDMSTPLVSDDYGNNFDTAEAIQLGVEVTGKSNYRYDYDVFSFTTPVDGNYSINIKASYYKYFAVYDENKSSVYSYSDNNQWSVNGNVSWSTNISAGKTYYIRFTNYGSNPNTLYTIQVTLPDDIEKPTAPTGLTSSKTPSTVTLSWEASQDNIKVAGYKIYRDNTQVGDTDQTGYTDRNLIPGRTYSYYVKAYDVAGNLSLESEKITITTDPDNESPAKPEDFRITSYTSTSVNLGWTASTDNVKVTGYKVYRNGVLLSNTTNTYYTDYGIQKGVAYVYRVAAYDISGNVSEESEEGVFDNVPPATPEQFDVDEVTSASVTMSWSASSDNLEVAGYHIYRDGARYASTNDLFFKDENVLPGKVYIYAVAAFDKADNSSKLSESKTVEIPTDTEPPQAPSGLDIYSKTDTTVSLAWTASIDNVGVKEYRVYLDGVEAGRTIRTDYTYTWEVPAYTCTFTVYAYDEAGNASSASNAVVCDYDLPSVPVNLSASADKQKVILSWDASTDNTEVEGYEIFRDGESLGTVSTTSYEDTGLYPATEYTYAVRAYDKSGNYSQMSDSIIVKTGSPEPPPPPTGLAVTAVTGSTVSVQWNALSQQTGVVGYKIYRDGVEIGGTTATTYKDLGLISNKTYTYTVRAFDKYDNISQESNAVTAIPVKPNIISVDPIEGETIGGDTQRKLQVKVTNNGNSSGLRAVFEYSTDGVNWNEISGTTYGPEIMDDGTVSFYKNWNLRSLSSGSYMLRYTVYDSSDDSDYKVVNCTVDRTPPQDVRNLEGISENGVISLKWSPVPDDDVKHYQVYRSISGEEGTYYPIDKVVNDTKYTDNAVTLNTTYFYKVTAVDMFDQEGQSSSTISVLCEEVDRIPPAISAFYPDGGTRLGSVTSITVEAKDNIKVASIKLQYSTSDGVEWQDIGSVYTSNKAVFGWNTSGINGIVKLRAIAYDTSDNETTEIPVWEYIIDNKGPAKITGLNAVAYTTRVALRWNDVPDDDFDVFMVERKDAFSGTYLTIGSVKDVLGMNITGLKPDTSYWFRVVAYDDLGNRGEYSDDLIVKTEKDTSSPTIVSYSPPAAYYNNVIPFVATIYDDVGVVQAVLQISKDKAQWEDVKTLQYENPQANTVFSYEMNVSAMEEGSYYMRVVSMDGAGNKDEAPPMIEYGVDRTAPSKPQGFLTVPSQGHIELKWEQGQETDFSHYKIYRSGSESGVYSLIKNNYTNVGYFDRNVQQGQTYYYMISAVDRAGNESEEAGPLPGEMTVDNEKPKVLSIYPDTGTTLPAKTTISVLASDNYKLSKVSLEYISADDTSGQWTLIGSKDLNIYGDTVIFEWDASNLPEKKYMIRAIAYDQAGFVSEPKIVEYNINVLPPQAPVLTATPGDWRVELSWTTANESDLSMFRVYRKIGIGGEYCLLEELGKLTTSYSDLLLQPGLNYYYFVEAYDRYGNVSKSAEVVAVPDDIDPYAPTARAGEDMTALTGEVVSFDGTLSSDNDCISRYLWDFGDGTTSSASKPTHIYTSEGVFTVSLTVFDPSGNSDSDTLEVKVYSRQDVGTLQLQVIDSATGSPVPYSDIVLEKGEGWSQKFTADALGVANIVAEAGSYKLSAYKTGYKPQSVNVTIEANIRKIDEIRLAKGDILTGELKVRRMSLDEIIDAGIRVDAPENQWIYECQVILPFVEDELPPLIFDRNGNLVQPWEPSLPGYVLYPHIIVTRTDVAPTVVIMSIPQESSWLKEFFEVSLMVSNTADEEFVVTDSKATLKLPEGLTLAPTREGQSLEIDMGSIIGGQKKTVQWIIRGDKKGWYNLSADFKGTLKPFDVPVRSTFTTKEPFRVWGDDALEMFIEVEDWFFNGEDYHVYYGLKNVSDVPVYNVTMKFSSNDIFEYRWYRRQLIQEEFGSPLGITVECLAPGETFWVDCCYKPRVTGQLGDSYRLLGAFVVNTSSEDVNIKTHLKIIESARKRFHQRIIFLGFYGDPVDTSTGANIINESLLKVNGVNTLSFDAEYNSQLFDRGPLGKGWSHNFEAFIEPLQEDILVVHWTASQWNKYCKDSSGKYISYEPAVKFDSIVKNDDGSYTMTRKDMSTYDFAADGRLVSIKDKYGRSLSLNYNANGQLGEIVESLSGQSLTLSYNKNGLIEKVSDKLSRQVTISYNSNDYIESITKADGKTTTYVYDDKGRMVSVINPDGQKTLTNTFDSKNRVISQDDSIVENKLTTFSYDDTDDTGRLITTASDRNGNITEFTYNRRHHLLSSKDELGRVTKFTYDSYGNVTSKLDPDGNLISYTYDDKCNLIEIVDAKGNKTTMTYDDGGNQLTIENDLGEKVVKEYDSNNNLISITDRDGNKVTYTYDSNGLVTSRTDPQTGTTEYSYTNGRLTEVKDHEGNIISYEYDAAGRPSAVIDAEGNKTSYAYDNADNVISITGPSGNKTTFTYDNSNNLSSKTDAKGNTTKYSYDSNGRLTVLTDAAGNKTSFSYDGEGKITRIVDANGNEVNLEHDEKGRISRVSDGELNSMNIEYNDLDLLTGIVNGNGTRILTVSYDSIGNAEIITDASGNTTTNRYDDLYRLVQTLNARGLSTEYEYDKLDRLIEVTDPMMGISTQSFDGRGNLLLRVDPNGNETRYDYDISGKLMQETDAIGNITKYLYDTNNLLLRKTNARGQEINCKYDEEGRITSIESQSGTVTYEYDANGKVISVEDGNGSTATEYDKLDRMTSYTDADGNTIGYSYDNVGNLTKIIYPDGREVYYTYDNANRIIAVMDWANRVTEYEYNVNGYVSKITRPDGSVQTMTYNEGGRLIKQNNVDKNSSTISSYDLDYDSSGNLISEEGGYRFDKVALKSLSMAYGKDNCLVKFNDQDVEYDADGNMVYGPLNGVLTDYIYDEHNRLIKAGDTSIGYDFEGRVTKVTDNSGTTSFAISPHTANGQVLVKTGPDGKKTYYVYGLGLIGHEEDGKYVNYHFDVRGSTTELTDINGNITDRLSYSPYGQIIARTGSSQTPFLFKGKEGVNTVNNTLCYIEGRFYNSEIARFVSKDAWSGDISDTQSLNRYTYRNVNKNSFYGPFISTIDTGCSGISLPDVEELIRQLLAIPDDHTIRTKWAGREPPPCRWTGKSDDLNKLNEIKRIREMYLE